MNELNDKNGKELNLIFKENPKMQINIEKGIERLEKSFFAIQDLSFKNAIKFKI